MTYLLSHYFVLLGCGGKRQECFGLNISLCGSGCKDAAAVAECKIFEAKRCAVGIGASVLSCAEEEEVCDYDHITFVLEDIVA